MKAEARRHNELYADNNQIWELSAGKLEGVSVPGMKVSETNRRTDRWTRASAAESWLAGGSLESSIRKGSWVSKDQSREQTALTEQVKVVSWSSSS